jgi:uncharacterized lipoprotein NlpE involved in copper resistance
MASEPSAEEITLATLRDWAERAIRAPAANRYGHAAGYERACRDALAILDMNGHPAGEPVIFPAPD